MLLSIEIARSVLPKLPLVVSGNNAMVLAIFLFPLFPGAAYTHYILTTMAVAAGIGLVAGTHLTFRSSFDSIHGLWYLFYVLLTMEFLFSGGCSALALATVGQANLGWLAVCTNGFVLLLTLLGGMYREAKRLELWGNAPYHWKKKLVKYIDYSHHQVSPLLTSDFPLMAKGQVVKSPFWIAAVGSANIPLLFEIYGGGRANAIFFAAPAMTGVMAYLNLTSLGPGLVRLLLLRKLEKTAGRRFINADLEQIQELRRSFFLARWLMKDFAPMQMPASKRVNKNH